MPRDPNHWSSAVSIATSGDLLPWYPHGHILATVGAFSDDGAFHPLETWDSDAVMRLFRERLLARLIERHAISEDLARRLLAWRHPGFSAHVGKAIPFEDKKAIEDVACYIVRNPLSLKKLVVRRARVNRARLKGRDRFAIRGLDGQKAVLYRSRMNPSLGRNFEALDPLEWLALLADHIPDPGKHGWLLLGAARLARPAREGYVHGDPHHGSHGIRQDLGGAVPLHRPAHPPPCRRPQAEDGRAHHRRQGQLRRLRAGPVRPCRPAARLLRGQPHERGPLEHRGAPRPQRGGPRRPHRGHDRERP